MTEDQKPWETMGDHQFREEVMQAMSWHVEAFTDINNAVGVLRVALEMLCAKHGDDPAVLMEAARQHIKQEAEE